MTQPSSPAQTLRSAPAAALGQALLDSRADTLATLARYHAALPDLQVPLRDTLNPPLWELGHIGWFQTWWLGRFTQRDAGWDADPDLPRLPPAQAGADACYHSSLVPHDSRWQLPLPGLADTCRELARGLDESLALLARCADDDRSLYFHRLVLFHEDMHHEAALYMAQALGLPEGPQAAHAARWLPEPLRGPRQALPLAAAQHTLGSAMAEGQGFVFDNELGAHPVALAATQIDSRVLSWAEYLAFADAGGYQQPQWWSAAGWRWQCTRDRDTPAYLRRRHQAGASVWQQWRHGRWQALDADEPACHLSAHEAEAWCRWAGRRLPSEAEWEHAACSLGADFHWGAVWEWTASDFQPYPGFVAHPYRDYSAPWFGPQRRVLRGGSHMSQPRMRHPRYRNFFAAQRTDVPAGLRSCAPAPG